MIDFIRKAAYKIGQLLFVCGLVFGSLLVIITYLSWVLVEMGVSFNTEAIKTLCGIWLLSVAALFVIIGIVLMSIGENPED